MKRVPVVPTIIVALAIAIMIALGVWQLVDRMPKKEAFLAQLAANPARSPIAFPRIPDDTLLFRRTRGDCQPPVSVKLAGAGASGYRAIASCRAGTEAPGMIVQLGTTRDPNAKVAWTGGAVSGFISHAPDGRSLIGSLFDHRAQAMMLVADTPPPGLAPNGRPDISSVPNNHLAYGVQWFLFAAIAGVIYVLAVVRRSPRG
ncbi:SURF1 family cytochrome oxidase biogenesis protein [Sphingomonas sp. PB2P19]|uniref:SURF1 family cytochrome oxidase biogenesis protein n=1 Tax=Sphingomonas rhamnosi TaxID=3096156 RepID=UPI002FCAF1D8